jgi:hypothetical protein
MKTPADTLCSLRLAVDDGRTVPLGGDALSAVVADLKGLAAYDRSWGEHFGEVIANGCHYVVDDDDDAVDP